MSRIEQLLALQKESPSDAFIIYALSLEYAKSGSIKEAISTLDDLMKSQPDYLGTYYQLGKLHEQSNDKTAAREVYEAGIERSKEAGDQHTLSELQSANTNLDYA